MKHIFAQDAHKQIFLTLLFSSFVSVALLVIRVVLTGSNRLTFLVWNLFLAWLPLCFAYWLARRSVKKKKPDWQDGGVALLWLVFVPNAFYLITDLIHLQSSGEVGLLYDTALITSFVINGLLLGYTSVFIVHQWLKKYTTRTNSFLAVQTVLLLSAFAIYLGRYLRWNTWDIVINPGGLLFDVSERIVNPGSYELTFIVTITFFVVLGSAYAVVYRLAGLAGVHDRS